MSRAALALALAGLLLGGCATLFTGTTDQVSFDANVPGVRLFVDGEFKGELPVVLDLSRNFVGGQQFIATFERKGYQSQEFKLHRSFNTVAILDLFSTVTSGGIDVLTGALMKFDPTSYHVQMLPEGKSAASPEFERSLRAWGVALATWRAVQKDLARGGGEHLTALARELSDGDPGAAARIEAAALRDREALVDAWSAHRFVARLDEALAASPDAVAYRVNR
ncbi:MAG TPA: hypothetical protein VF875_13330 [Anaeromyxobacter sp.]